MRENRKFIAKLLTFWIPISSVRKNLRYEFIQLFKSIEIQKIKKNYPKIFKKIQLKVQQSKKIRVAFLCMYATDIQNLCIYNKMLESDIFEPYCIVNPDIMRSKENFYYNYNRTKKELIEKYGKNRVLDGYNFETKTYIDYTKYFDIATTNNPYDHMANEYFKIKYWTKKHIPVFYISYFYMGRCFVTIENLKLFELSCFWKIFSENHYVKKLAEEYQIIKGDNIVVTGYPKLDLFNDIKIMPRNRKKVILAPHHTIGENDVCVGAFLSYYGDLIELSKKFPEVDFIYRPHPLLEENLTRLWGKERYKEWLNSFLSQSNVAYSTEGNYQDLFINSDALVHDCGSFSAEYLCTGHPCAYWFKQTANYNKIHTELGQKCIDLHYLIKTKHDLFNFIENTVIKGIDPKKENRLRFAKEEIMVNYPNATKTIMEILIKEIVGDK